MRLLAAAAAAPDRPIGGARGAGACRAADHPGAVERDRAAGGCRRRCRRCSRAQALRTPDALALVFEERALSYAELEAHANQLAHHLRALGVGPETVVGCASERSPEMVIGLLGILKAGAAYLPLDPGYPAERLAFMLADAQAAVLVTQSGAAGAAVARRSHRQPSAIVRLDADADRDRAAAAHRARRRRSTRATRPTSSTPRARPEHPRAWWSTHGGLAQLPRLDARAGGADGRPTGCWRSPPSASTSRRSSSTCR